MTTTDSLHTVTTRQALSQAFDALLQPERFKDYGPNGLQVEGKADIARIVSGVTASRALIEAAIAHRADAIFVHHGLFWRGQDGRITGWMRERLRLLLAHDINLFAYHLPPSALVSRTWALPGRPILMARRRWPTMWPSAWAAP